MIVQSAYSLTVLIENEVGANSELIAEHGLSLVLEIPTGERFLFDAGQTGEALCRNARALEFDLGRLDGVVLSHGHYDHMGGLPFLAPEKSIPLYAHPAVLRKSWVEHSDASPKMVSMELDLERLKKKGLIYTPTAKPREIFPGGFLSGPLEGPPDPRTAKGFTIESEKGRILDPFEHEQFLIFKSSSGWVLVTGCCHHGVRSTLDHARKFTGGEAVATVIGGLHTRKFSDDELAEVWEIFRAFGVKRLLIGHCTGAHAVEHAQRHSGLNVQPLTTGSRITL